MTTTRKSTTVDVANVRHHDGPLMLPEGLSTKAAIQLLERKLVYDEQDFAINAEFDCFVYEGAHALNFVLQEKFGWAGAQTVKIETFFGTKEIPPTLLNVPVDVGVIEQVPWGRFSLPGVTGYLETGVHFQGGAGGMFGPQGRALFAIGGRVKRKDEAKVKVVIEAVKARLKAHSLYANKAFRLRLKQDGEWMEQPDLNFLELMPSLEKELVLSTRVGNAVKVNLFTPIERTAEVRREGVPLKRGILLAGPYGTGKTMISGVTALKALRNGWTYIVCENGEELADVIRIARSYQPCVVFCEDIDRIVNGERSVSMDHILNVIDGVESKNAELLIVLTTNDMDSINPALLRPGRLDAIVTVAPPDAEAAERLARMYARGRIADDAVLERAPALMAGKISSVIREITERSKLAAIALSEPGKAINITDDALVEAALDMDEHIKAATPRPADRRSEREKAAAILAEGTKELATAIRETSDWMPALSHEVNSQLDN